MELNKQLKNLEVEINKTEKALKKLVVRKRQIEKRLQKQGNAGFYKSLGIAKMRWTKLYKKNPSAKSFNQFVLKKDYPELYEKSLRAFVVDEKPVIESYSQHYSRERNKRLREQEAERQKAWDLEYEELRKAGAEKEAIAKRHREFKDFAQEATIDAELGFMADNGYRKVAITWESIGMNKEEFQRVPIHEQIEIIKPFFND